MRFGAARSKVGRAWVRIVPSEVAWVDGLGAATVSWDSATDEPAEVWVARDGSETDLFAVGPRGRAQASWIGQGIVYEFRLYGPDHAGPPMATAKVTMSSRPRGRPFIVAKPNPVPRQSVAASTTLTWDTGDGSDGLVRLITRTADSQEEVLVAQGPRGSTTLDWILPDTGYRFRLYRAVGDPRPIATVKVTMSGDVREVVADVAVIVAVVALSVFAAALVLVSSRIAVRIGTRVIRTVPP